MHFFKRQIFHCYHLFFIGKINSYCVWGAGAWIQSDITLIHTAFWGVTKCDKLQRGNDEHREVSIFSLCVCSSPSLRCICVYSCDLKGGGGRVCTRKEVWALPHSIWHKGPPPLCMLAASVGDKVWSWEIRSGPANETHGKGLHRNLTALLLFFYWSISFFAWY